MVFIDTNVFFYFYDDRFPERQACSREWLKVLAVRELGIANLQVANEFTNIVFKRLPHLSYESVFHMADDILVWGAAATSAETIAAARSVRGRHGYSWWDCLLLASALELGCTHFLSEDMQDGQHLQGLDGKGLTIVDPFAHRPDQILIAR